MKSLLAVTFFVLNGQCWMTDGQQAINLANTFSIESHGDSDLHFAGGSSYAYVNADLPDLLKQMREVCGSPAAAKTQP